jgi:hypothetical protein
MKQLNHRVKEPLKESLKRLGYLLLLVPLLAIQTGCGYVAAGAVGAAVGHEVAKDEEDDD